MSKRLDELARGFRKRTWVTAKLASRVGIRAAKRNFLGASGDPVDTPASTAGAEELVETLGRLKGLVMKVGQMASYLPGALPPEAQRVLARLQAQSTAMDAAKVRGVVEAELGAPVAELFEAFDDEPFAAASIGQVHRARFEGRDVAVKVQYPGVADVLESDLDVVGLMAKASTLGLPLDGGALVAELEERIIEECDYELEARHQRELGSLLARDPDARTPAVVEARSARRVLTSELVEAASFEQLRASEDQAAKDRAGEVIFRSCFRCLFQHGLYNGDPHPGNYLFDEDGQVVFLDFGSVRRFDEGFIETWKAFARCVIDGDRASFEDRFRDLGMIGRAKGFDFDYQWHITQHLYAPFLEDNAPFTFTDEYVRDSYGLLIFDNPNQRKMAMPREWLLLNRLQWGLNAVLAQLDATGDWPRYFREAAEGPFLGSD